MEVMKFGGTSVGSPERMKEVATLITKSGNPTFVVLSAMSGTTNTLIEISDYLYKKNPEGANEIINRLERKYLGHLDELFLTEAYKQKTKKFITEEFNYLRTFTKDLFTSFEEKAIVAQGEFISTNMVVNYLQEQGIKATLLNALDFMRTDKNAEPDLQFIREKLTTILENTPDQQIY
ncbi:MAG: aspartate kinase, partial [Prevotella bivia]|nr:aspartate kinase [Prevotella bivia]